MSRRQHIFMFSIFSFIISAIFLLRSEGVITGAAVGPSDSISSDLPSGLIFLILSAFLQIATHYSDGKEKRHTTDENDGGLVTLISNVVSEDAKRDIAHLTQGLEERNFHVGIGTKHLEGTKLNYLRGRNGGRVFYQQTGPDSYQVVGVSDKHHEQRIIKKLKKEYPSHTASSSLPDVVFPEYETKKNKNYKHRH